MLIRMVKLLGVSAFYIGRLDTPFFAPGVGQIGPIALDGHPVQFRKDLLLHDAHRHPYMERLGVIYLLKLRYGEHFGNRAGGQWRLIFVIALMPWLRRYRLDDGTNSNSSNERFDLKNDELEYSTDDLPTSLEPDRVVLPNDVLEQHEMSTLQLTVRKLNDTFGKEEARSFLESLLLPL